MRAGAALGVLCLIGAGCASHIPVKAPTSLSGQGYECWFHQDGKLACSKKMFQQLGPRHYLILSPVKADKPCTLRVEGVAVVLPTSELETNQTSVLVEGCRFQWVNGQGPG